MSEQLSERGKDLVKHMPQAVNALADRLTEKLTERVLYGEKPQTNADRIRAMTDKEMAQFLYDCTDHPRLEWWQAWVKQSDWEWSE